MAVEATDARVRTLDTRQEPAVSTARPMGRRWERPYVMALVALDVTAVVTSIIVGSWAHSQFFVTGSNIVATYRSFCWRCRWFGCSPWRRRGPTSRVT